VATAPLWGRSLQSLEQRFESRQPKSARPLSWSWPVLQGARCLTAASGGEVAGRGPSPLPPWPSPVTGLAFEVFPRRLPRIEQDVRCDRLLRLGSPSERSSRAGSVTLLSWDSSACASPPTCRSDVHSQEPLPAPFGQVLPHTRSRSAFAVSHRPDGLLHPTVAGLLHPATGQRFIAFPAPPRPAQSEDGPEPREHFPRCGFTPLEGSPSSAAVPRHRGRCPPVVDTRSTPRHDRSDRTWSGSTARAASPSRSYRAAVVQLEHPSGIRTEVVLPSCLPCSTRSTLIPARCRSCRSSPALELGVVRSSPSLATPRRHEGGSRSKRRRDCTRMQRPAGLRTASTRPVRRPSEEGRLGALCEPGLARHRATGVARLAPSRPAWTAGWHLVRCRRVDRGALSMG
jgi:hypothetical protein